jgi:hypothetical protein
VLRRFFGSIDIQPNEAAAGLGSKVFKPSWSPIPFLQGETRKGIEPSITKESWHLGAYGFFSTLILGLNDRGNSEAPPQEYLDKAVQHRNPN